MARSTRSERAWPRRTASSCSRCGRPEGLDRLDVGVLLDPLVGELGEHELLHLLHRDGEVGRLLGPGGRGGELPLVVGQRADQVVVEVVGDPAPTELVQPVLGVETGHRLAVPGGGEVERDEVALDRRAVDVDELAMRAEHRVDAALELLVGDLGVGQLHPQAAVAGHADAGPDLDGGVEQDGPVLLAAGDVDVGRVDDVDVVLAHGLGQVARDGVAQGLLARRCRADAGLEHAAGCLARPEPGDADLSGDLAERRVEVLVELRFVHLDGQLHQLSPFFPLEGFQRALHRGDTLPGRPWLPGQFERAAPGRRASLPSGRLPSGRMTAYADLEAARPRQAPRRSARPPAPRQGRGHGRAPRRARGHQGQDHPHRRLQLDALPRPVRQRRGAGRPRRPQHRADRPGRQARRQGAPPRRPDSTDGRVRGVLAPRSRPTLAGRSAVVGGHHRGRRLDRPGGEGRDTPRPEGHRDAHVPDGVALEG